MRTGGFRLGRADGTVPDQRLETRRLGGDDFPGPVRKQSKGEFLLAQEGLSFCSIQAFRCLNEAYLHNGEQSALLKVHPFQG